MYRIVISIVFKHLATNVSWSTLLAIFHVAYERHVDSSADQSKDFWLTQKVSHSFLSTQAY